MLSLLTNLRIWLSLHLLRGPFGTRHAAALPASFLLPCLDSALNAQELFALPGSLQPYSRLSSAVFSQPL